MINIVNGAKYNAKLSSQRALKLDEKKNISRSQESVYFMFYALHFSLQSKKHTFCRFVSRKLQTSAIQTLREPPEQTVFDPSLFSFE